MSIKQELVTGEIYHIYNRSIANFKIFNSGHDYLRMKHMLMYYKVRKMLQGFSRFYQLDHVREIGFCKYFVDISKEMQPMSQIIAYCIMPTHLHLILKQLSDGGISTFMSNVFNSYSRYFNILHKRKGPLWEGRFKKILVEDDNQLLHLTRYIHLNPVTGYLVDNPDQWPPSSYNEYLSRDNGDDRICDFDGLLDINAGQYKNFVDDRIGYQRELHIIKKHLID